MDPSIAMKATNTLELLEFFRFCSKSDLQKLVDNSVVVLTSVLEDTQLGANATATCLKFEPWRVQVDMEKICMIWPTDAVTNSERVSWFLASVTRSLVDDDSGTKSTMIRSKTAAVVMIKSIVHGLLNYNRCAERVFQQALKLVHSANPGVSVFNNGQSKRIHDSLEWIQDLISDQTHLSKITLVGKPQAVVLTKPPKTVNNITEGKSTLLVPCAGRSSRFPGFKPKWLLTMPNGRLMFADAISKLNLDNVSRIVVGVLQGHVNKHCNGEATAVFKCLEDCQNISGIELTVVVLDSPTIDQVQTIECMLHYGKVNGPVFFKDCDNQFECKVPVTNTMATLDLTRDIKSLDSPAGKSYATFLNFDLDNIVEKEILGSTFCVGGYSFADSEEFINAVNHLRAIQRLFRCSTELAISDVIWFQTISAKTSGASFSKCPVSNYEDWGTLLAWRKYCDTFRTCFIDIDGTLVKNSGAYFQPNWGMKDSLTRNVAHLQSLYQRGRTQIILTTSRTEEFREVTEKQLEEAKIPYDDIIFGLLHSKRVLINDYAKTNPYPSAMSINLRRDDDNLEELLGFY